ncbi:SDR family NAD(P)-dependent oxidoreductase [Trebonia kvetii]|uniref:SDR family NAD(P)-dependent oxidoreductase n=1 Tax=Trebonia kvetii TaxID=2480626 RepID=A0A6P2BWQ1_9ACTN|nr:SDR family NAD(P)-dependent oxidoreductase [Trebonia kvetii]TVZ02575.1 SDR family NAD(P)-dependent oxidoreductase [Trebonia kvetii]
MGAWGEQVAIVTGGGKGLGRAFALDLARRGVRVLVNNRNREVDADGRGPADHVVTEIVAAGGVAVAHHGAVEDPASADGMVELALGAWGRLDILITSAGISRPQMFHKATLDNFRQVLDVNVLGTVLVASAAARVMRGAGHGRILMVSSIAGLFGEPTVSAYAASKGAVIALAKTVAVEGAARRVYTNVLLPYATTQMTAHGMDQRYAALMAADSVAPVAAALVHPRSQINGATVVAGANGVRYAETSEGMTVTFPGGDIEPADLASLLKTSSEGARNTFAEAQDAFQSLAADLK